MFEVNVKKVMEGREGTGGGGEGRTSSGLEF